MHSWHTRYICGDSKSFNSFLHPTPNMKLLVAYSCNSDLRFSFSHRILSLVLKRRSILFDREQKWRHFLLLRHMNMPRLEKKASLCDHIKRMWAYRKMSKQCTQEPVNGFWRCYLSYWLQVWLRNPSIQRIRSCSSIPTVTGITGPTRHTSRRRSRSSSPTTSPVPSPELNLWRWQFQLELG